MTTLLVSAIALIRNRRVLMVTARDREVIYMPGGKQDPGETAAQAAAREAHEEVSLELDPAELEELFTVFTPAHGQAPGTMVRMTLFRAHTSQEPAPSAEVSELHWATTADLHRCPPAGRAVVERLAAQQLID